MLAMTKKTDYALIALSCLAGRTGELVSARELARLSRVPLPMLTNVLKILAHSGIILSERGAAGGYRLARPAQTINLDELLSAVEGPFQFVQCGATSGAPGEDRSVCELLSHCPIRKPAQKIQGKIKAFLQNLTLAELFGEPGESVSVDIDIKPCRVKPQASGKEFAR